jgi:hypothetical protein
MEVDKVKTFIGFMIVFYIIIGIDCLFLEPNPAPVKPKQMVTEYVVREDADHNAVPNPEYDPNKPFDYNNPLADDNMEYIMDKKTVPKEFDAKTDSIWEGVRLRNFVYFCMGALMFFGDGAVAYFVFTGSVYYLSIWHVLPPDVPATGDVLWQMFFGPLILMAYCAYAGYKTFKG